MTNSRRRLLGATAAGPLAAPWIAGTARAEGKQLKISHQFPGGTIDSGDFRDQMCRQFAAASRSRHSLYVAFQGSLDGSGASDEQIRCPLRHESADTAALSSRLSSCAAVGGERFPGSRCTGPRR